MSIHLKAERDAALTHQALAEERLLAVSEWILELAGEMDESIIPYRVHTIAKHTVSDACRCRHSRWQHRAALAGEGTIPWRAGCTHCDCQVFSEQTEEETS